MKQFAAILVSSIVVAGFVVVSVFGVIHGLQDNPTLNTLCGGLSTMAALMGWSLAFWTPRRVNRGVNQSISVSVIRG